MESNVLSLARTMYSRGENVITYLSDQFGDILTETQIIEISYDLQAGSYIDDFCANPELMDSITNERALMLNEHLIDGGTLLDAGAGELTKILPTLMKCDPTPRELYAFDLSWSRLSNGINFFEDFGTNENMSIVPFVATMASIPLPSKSIDVTTTSHALEPNGSQLKTLLVELIRVTRNKLVLFEPYYEGNSKEGRKRMDSLGYIKDIEFTINELGVDLVDIQPMKNCRNPLNPTTCFVINLAPYSLSVPDANYSFPGTDKILEPYKNFLISPDFGVAFPLLNGVPMLRKESAIVANALFRNPAPA